MSHYDYLLLPRLDVRHANAMSAYWVLSPEVVMAARQMAHALARHLGIPGQDAGVAIVHHHVDMLGEQLPRDSRFKPHQRRGAVLIDRHDYSSRNKHALSLQPTASMHLRVTLIFRFKAGCALDEDAIRDFLRGGRLAGGQIVDYGKLKAFATESELRRELPSGHLVADRSAALVSDGKYSLCDQFFDALHNEEWLVPATLGYATITPLAYRPGARGAFPLAYAEPLVGLIEYQSLNRVADHDALAYWDYDFPEPGVYCLTQT